MFRVSTFSLLCGALLAASLTACGGGADAGMVHGQTWVNPAMAAPTNLALHASEMSGVRLLWDAVSNADGYNVYRNDQYVTTVFHAQFFDTGTDFAGNLIPAGTTYYVTAFGGDPKEFSVKSYVHTLVTDVQVDVQPGEDTFVGFEENHRFDNLNAMFALQRGMFVNHAIYQVAYASRGLAYSEEWDFVELTGDDAYYETVYLTTTITNDDGELEEVEYPAFTPRHKLYDCPNGGTFSDAEINIGVQNGDVHLEFDGCIWEDGTFIDGVIDTDGSKYNVYNTIERLTIIEADGTIELNDLTDHVRGAAGATTVRADSIVMDHAVFGKFNAASYALEAGAGVQENDVGLPVGSNTAVFANVTYMNGDPIYTLTTEGDFNTFMDSDYDGGMTGLLIATAGNGETFELDPTHGVQGDFVATHTDIDGTVDSVTLDTTDSWSFRVR